MVSMEFAFRDFRVFLSYAIHFQGRVIKIYRFAVVEVKRHGDSMNLVGELNANDGSFLQRFAQALQDFLSFRRAQEALKVVAVANVSHTRILRLNWIHAELERSAGK
jgi:hypothetical protein